MITAEDEKDWSSHPVTKKFLLHLRNSRQETMEIWATKGFVGSDAPSTLAANSHALGGIAVLDQVIDHIEAMKETSDE